jgi:antitoxin HicB
MESIEERLRLPYHVVLVRDEDGDGEIGYVASVQELPGCMSQSDTPDEAVQSIQDAMYGWIKVALEDGKTIPEPDKPLQYSGKFLVRAPKSLHALLMQRADDEGVSFNQYVVGALAGTIGWRGVDSEVPTSAVAHKKPHSRTGSRHA